MFSDVSVLLFTGWRAVGYSLFRSCLGVGHLVRLPTPFPKLDLVEDGKDRSGGCGLYSNQ